MQNVYFDWFNQYLCTGEHFQSSLDIFQFNIMVVKPHDVPPLLCVKVQTELRFCLKRSCFKRNLISVCTLTQAAAAQVSHDTVLLGCLICFPQVKKEQLPTASGQMRPGDIFQDSSGGRWCYDVSWSHTVFCRISQIFQITRWSEYWSCILGPCIGL